MKGEKMKRTEQSYLYKNSNGYYEAITIENGKRKKKSLKVKTKSEALKKLNELKEFNFQTQKQFVNFSTFETEYLKYIEPIRTHNTIERSVKLTFRMFKNFLESDSDIRDISTKQAELFFSSIYQTSPYSARLYYRVLKSAFNTAIRWGYTENNPFLFKLPKAHKNIPVYVSLDQLNQIINHTNKQAFKDIYLFAFFTGLRLGEIINLKVNCVNLDMKTITVRNQSGFVTKGKAERVIPIAESLEILLRSYISKKDENEYLFQKYPGMKFESDNVSKTFKKAVKSANLDSRIHFHSLRHSFGSALAQNNISPIIIQKLLGHQDIKTSMIYTHVTSNNLVEAVASINKNTSSHLDHKVNFFRGIPMN